MAILVALWDHKVFPSFLGTWRKNQGFRGLHLRLSAGHKPQDPWDLPSRLCPPYLTLSYLHRLGLLSGLFLLGAESRVRDTVGPTQPKLSPQEPFPQPLG